MKKIKKRVFVPLLAGGILFLGLAGRHSFRNRPEEEIRKTLALVTFEPTHSWASDVKNSMEEELIQVCKNNDWDYILKTGGDSTEQSVQMIELAKQQVDGIILFPMDGASVKTAALLVQKEDIPLVVFDREIPDFAPAATVKGDNAGIGICSATYLNECFPKGCRILELMGDKSTVPSQRTAGFDEALNENMVKEQVGYTDWQREKAKERFQSWAADHGKEEKAKIEAVYVHDDEIAFGVLDALQEEDFPNLKLMVGGTSGVEKTYERIKEEEKLELAFALYSPSMSREAVRVAEKILKEEKYKEMTIIPTVMVDKTNVEEFLQVER